MKTKRRPLSQREGALRAKASEARRDMVRLFRKAFREDEMASNGMLIVLTKGQMRGIRATLLRMRGSRAV